MGRMCYAALALVLPLAVLSAAPAQGTARAAKLIGAYSKTWPAADAKIGPLQTNKFFYGALPTSYADETLLKTPGCGAKDSSGKFIFPPARVTCLINYHTLSSNLQAFIQSIPANRNVIMDYCGEPEGAGLKDCGKAATFKRNFETQSALVTRYSHGAPNIKIAEDSEAYQYDPGTNHDNGGAPGHCPFIVPPAYVNYYLVDIYEPNLTSAQNLGQDVEWTTWVGCTANTAGVPRGIAEYGILCGKANSPIVAKTITADNTYLEANFPNLEMWEYWYWGGCVFTRPATIAAWQAVEAGT